jgi:ubiquinol-cytochrome c reductase iron-sulfur subunit
MVALDHRFDGERRVWLAGATATAGAGLAATAVPFVASLAPSERARALGAPVEVRLDDLGPGAIKTVEWRGRPVFVLRRSPSMLDQLGAHDGLLTDPRSLRSEQPEAARNPDRSLRREIVVLEAVCTHLGCVPAFRPEPGAADIGSDWPGGFFCPCHGSKFDLAGRVFKNVPAPTNLGVPPHQYLSGARLLIGAEDKA